MFFNVSKKLKGFTVAELAITIAVIGVIAAITMPLAYRHFHGVEFETANNRLQYQINQTLERMGSEQTLTGHSTTQDFVDVFRTYFETAKVCHSGDLTGCFPETFVAGEEDFSLSDVKGSEFMGKDGWKTDVEGIVLKNGFNLLVAYNPHCSKKNPANCASILYDLNSIEKDNIFLGNGQSDLGTFNAAFVGGSSSSISIVDLGTSYSAVDCSNSSSSDYSKYCGNYPSSYSSDYWAGAQKACDDLGLVLPTKQKLSTLVTEGGEGIPTSGRYWSSSENDNFSAYFLIIDNGIVGFYGKNTLRSALCIAN